MRRLCLVLGGARSGKSDFAEDLAARLSRKEGLRKIYLATARTDWGGARDEEFADRIAAHRARRGEDWETIEAPDRLAEALAAADGPGRLLLVDCLTLWLSNKMLAEGAGEAAAVPGDVEMEPTFRSLLQTVRALKAPAILVSNEVGLGLVPETSLGRRFRDAQGRLNRLAAADSSLVLFVAAGLPLTLKGDLRDWSAEG